METTKTGRDCKDYYTLVYLPLETLVSGTNGQLSNWLLLVLATPSNNHFVAYRSTISCFWWASFQPLLIPSLIHVHSLNVVYSKVRKLISVSGVSYRIPGTRKFSLAKNFTSASYFIISPSARATLQEVVGGPIKAQCAVPCENIHG